MSTVSTKYGPLPTVSMPYLPIIEKYAKEYKIPVPIIAYMIKTESSGNPRAWNPSNGENSRGLMQISEKTALTHPSLRLKQTDLEKLFDPDFNIKNGAKLLNYLYLWLKPYFGEKTSEDTKWRVVTSSYNQGEGYYKKALMKLTSENKPQTWENIETAVLNPVSGGKPWTENVLSYAKSIMDNIDTRYLVGGGIGLGAIIIGSAIFYYLMKQPKIA